MLKQNQKWFKKCIDLSKTKRVINNIKLNIFQKYKIVQFSNEVVEKIASIKKQSLKICQNFDNTVSYEFCLQCPSNESNNFEKLKKLQGLFEN